MLRAVTRQSLLDQLDASYFGLSNFAVEFSDGDPVVVEIWFVPDRRFHFRIQRSPRESKYSFNCTEAPGEKFLLPNTSYHHDVQTALNRLNDWLERVKEELISGNPFARELASLRKQIDQRLAEVAEDIEGFFSSEEASDLGARLDALSAQLRDLESRNESLEGTVAALAKAIEDLKDASTVVSKGTWYRMASGRLLSGLKSLAGTKEAREFALEAAKKFLLEGPK